MIMCFKSKNKTGAKMQYINNKYETIIITTGKFIVEHFGRKSKSHIMQIEF